LSIQYFHGGYLDRDADDGEPQELHLAHSLPPRTSVIIAATRGYGWADGDQTGVDPSVT